MVKTNGKLRAYEPLLMSLRRFSDAFLGAALLPGLACFYGMYDRSYLILASFVLLIALVILHVMGTYQSWRTEALILTETRRLLAGCVGIYICLLYTSPSPRD